MLEDADLLALDEQRILLERDHRDVGVLGKVPGAHAGLELPVIALSADLLLDGGDVVGHRVHLGVGEGLQEALGSEVVVGMRMRQHDLRELAARIDDGGSHTIGVGAGPLRVDEQGLFLAQDHERADGEAVVIRDASHGLELLPRIRLQAYFHVMIRIRHKNSLLESNPPPLADCPLPFVLAVCLKLHKKNMSGHRLPYIPLF